MSPVVDFATDGAVAVVRVENPPANAMSAAVLRGLAEIVANLQKRSDLRVVVFTAAGEVSFLSGADLTEMPALLADPSSLTERVREVGALFDSIQALPQVTIGAANASAMGGGLEFLLVCDLIIAAERAKFALPEVKIGLIPGAGGTQRLYRRIAANRATEMLLTGRVLAAADAEASGLINRVSDGAVLDDAMAWAGRIAELPGAAVRAVKRAAVAGASLVLEEGLAVEAEQFSAVARTVDAKEGPTAFLERRQPRFTHQ
jgi:enoyl-CoA hydratase